MNRFAQLAKIALVNLPAFIFFLSKLSSSVGALFLWFLSVSATLDMDSNVSFTIVSSEDLSGFSASALSLLVETSPAAREESVLLIFFFLTYLFQSGFCLLGLWTCR